MYRRYKTAENQQKREEEKANTIVNACWKLVEDQCKENTLNELNKPSENNVGGLWKIVRVFVSSTFSDMFCEREVLVKKVFPELREWCEERRIRLMECDLRWGVPKDTNSEETIRCCMEELDRCHVDTNGCPFFITLLGERYGWIPEEKELGSDLKDQYSWVDNTSITHMEILHGAYRCGNPNALFLLRNPEIVGEIPEDFQDRFVDKDILSKCHVKELKNKLKTKFPDQFFEYQCKFSSVIEKAGRKRVILDVSDEFAERVLTFLKTRISQFYPECDVETNNTEQLDIVELEQSNFLERKTHFFIGYNEVIETLLAYAKGINPDNLRIEGEKTAFVRDPKFWQNEDDDNLMMCLSGDVGQGKTSILSTFVERAKKIGLKVFYHFVGATEASEQPDVLLRRMTEFIKGAKIDVPENTYDLKEFYMKVLKEEFDDLRQSKSQYLVVLDGLDELRSRDAIAHLSWLPPRFPGNVRMVVSTSTNHLPTLHRVKEHTCFLLEIPQLTLSEAKDVISQYLGQYNKKLDENQMKVILSKPSSLNPLWLTILAEQLRTFGDFRTLDKHIDALSDTINGLIQYILKDLIANDDTGKMEKALGVLVLSNGLPEVDMQNILGDTDVEEAIPALHWARIRRALKPFTYISGIDREIRFIHGAFYQNTDTLGMYHTIIVDYLIVRCRNHAIIQSKVPYHCQKANLYDKLVDFMRHSESASTIPSFRRSMILKSARCIQVADPVLPASMPVVLCRGCSHSYRGFRAKHFPMNKDACVICGEHIMSLKENVVDAFLCMRHSFGQSKLLGKCILCDMPVRKDGNGKVADFMGSHGKLCIPCSFGIGRKQCSYVGKKK